MRESLNRPLLGGLLCLTSTIALYAQNYAYVTKYSGNTVSVVDTSTNTVGATVAVGFGPVGVAITPDGTRAYVTNVNSNTVSVIDTSTNTVGPPVSSHIDTAGVAFRTPLERRHSGLSLTRLNTMPALPSHNASRLNLRTAVHVQVRRGRLALRRAELSSAYNSPV